MSDSVLLLQQVAAQLIQEGKTPNLALFRARLAGKVAPAQLFTAYQHWRANPIAISPSSTQLQEITSPTSNQDTAKLEQNIKSRLERVEAKLDRILSLLESR
ncbi:hypothetical protein [Rheinheimera sp. WS51]|uniref:hypothetical protein n=1 Tax=Rheinheimera sp. WS51 TaxID=3425886 RepID=UPI003D8DE902